MYHVSRVDLGPISHLLLQKGIHAPLSFQHMVLGALLRGSYNLREKTPCDSDACLLLAVRLKTLF